MKRGIVISLFLSAALAVLGAACSQPANVNTNSQMNRNATAMNANSMPSNMSNMPMNGNPDMTGMSDMKSSPNAANQPYDLQFIDTMSMHHQKATRWRKSLSKNRAVPN